MCSLRTSNPVFIECDALHPQHVVGELEHLVDAIDERLLDIAKTEEAVTTMLASPCADGRLCGTLIR